VAAAGRLEADGQRPVLVTLVEVTGSAYRRPGARMLVDRAGNTFGAVSSGCLEGDLAERARQVAAEGAPRLVAYDLDESDDLAWGLGLGCPGSVRLLIEPLTRGLTGLLAAVAAHPAPVVLGTVFEAGDEAGLKPCDRFARPVGAEPEAALPVDPALRPELETAIGEVAERGGRPRTVRLGEGARTFALLLERLSPPLRLLIFGSGADARHLARLAVGLGWETFLVAPGADGIAHAGGLPEEVRAVAGDPVAALEGIPLDERTAAVLLSHHFERDRALLERLLPSTVAYIGLLGSAPRRKTLFEAVGLQLVAAAGNRLHAPVGLDLGAERPEEIALAVAAEIQAALSGRAGGFLRDRERPIHDR
jgi:xanthine dehydrogenase accessory factor